MRAAAILGLLLAPLLAPRTAAAAPPPLGKVDGAQLCVAIGDAAPSCGPVELEWRRTGRARIRVSDIVYTLSLRTSQVDVALQHGAMEIDAFTGAFEWDGDTLRFVDAAKNMRYEVRPGRAR